MDQFQQQNISLLVPDEQLAGREPNLGRRQRNRRIRSIHLQENEMYLASINDISNSLMQNSDQSISDLSSNSDLQHQNAEIINNELLQSEENRSLNFDSDSIDPTKEEYISFMMSSLLGYLNLNLSAATGVVKLMNNMLLRFNRENNVTQLPNVEHFWRKLSSESEYHVYIVCQDNHLHGPFIGEPKDYGFYICNNRNVKADLKKEKFFFHIPLRQQLNLHLPNIREDQWITEESHEAEINDISESLLAKRVKGNRIDKLTLTLLADEVSATKSSNPKILPVFASINEIHPPNRRDHFFLTGLFVGETKPKPELFLKPICEELKDLETNSITWNSFKSSFQRSATFHLISVIADAPMRAYLRVVKQYNSNYGCDWCYVYAGSHDGSRCYPVMRYDRLMEIKRKKSHFVEFKDSLANPPHIRPRGPMFDSIVGVSPLIGLDSFDIVDGFVLEPMHAITLGTFKNLFINGLLSTGPALLNQENINIVKRVISSRLKMIKVPSTFSREPRGLDELAHFKSNEYDNFMCYYLPSVLHGLVPEKFLHHLILLAKIYHLSHRGPIIIADTHYLETLIYEFQCATQSYYGSNFLTYNLHILTHLPDSLKNHGPSSNMSAYPLEDHMGMLKKKVHRYSGIAQTLVRVFLCRFKYIETLSGSCLNWNLSSGEKKDFGMVKLGLVEDEMSSFRKFQGSRSQLTTHKVFARDMIERSYPNAPGNSLNDIEIYDFMKIGSLKVSSPSYSKEVKRDNSHFKTQQGKFYKVHMLLSSTLGYFVIGREFKEKTFKVKYRREDFSINFALDYIHVVERLMASYTLIPTHEIDKIVLFVPAKKFSQQRDQLIDPFLMNI